MQVFLVIICIVSAVGFLIYKLVRRFSKKKQADCGCGKCA